MNTTQYKTLTAADIIQEGDEFDFNGAWFPVNHSIGYPASEHLRRPVNQMNALPKSWHDQREELANARNQITDLTRRLEDAEFTRNITAELGMGTVEMSFKEVIAEVKKLRNGLCTTATLCMSKNVALHDKNATIRRLKEKLENVEPFIPTFHQQYRLDESARVINSLEAELSKAAAYTEALERDLSTAAGATDGECYEILVEIGSMFGIVAKVNEDGNLVEDVLVHSLPRLVANLLVEKHRQSAFHGE